MNSSLRPLSGALLAAVLSCGDVSGPARRELALSVCPDHGWVAFQNEAGQWTRLGGSAGGDVTIMATERLALAVASAGSPAALHLYFVGADQAQGVLGCYQPNSSQTRSLTGTTQGLSGPTWAIVSIGPSMGWLQITGTDFTLPLAAIGTRDLVATRHMTENGHHVNRLIVRRAQAHTDGVIPLLDFESSEAVAPAQNVVSWTAGGGEVRVIFHGADGNIHPLQLSSVGSHEAPEVPWFVPLYSVPADRQVPGDLHEVALGNAERSVVRFYRQPTDMALSLGPPVSEPTFTPVATSPSLRMRTDLPWQPEYDGYVTLQLSQPGPSGPRYVSITMTREHFVSAGASTTAAWSVTIPDLSAVDGVPSELGLQPGTFNWTLSSTNRRWDSKYALGAPADIHRSASRHGTAGN